MKKILVYICLLALPVPIHTLLRLWFPQIITDDGRYSLGALAVTSLLVAVLTLQEWSSEKKIVSRIFFVIAILIFILSFFAIFLANTII